MTTNNIGHVTSIPFTPLTEEEEKRVLEVVMKTSPAKYKNTVYRTSFFLGVYSEKVGDNSHGRGCHAEFGQMYGDDFLGLFNFWPNPEENLTKECQAALSRFINYIYDEAPCSYFIPFKDNEDVRAKGFFMPASLPKSFVHFFNIIGRTIHERPLDLEKWHKLVEAGVNPDIAMFLIKKVIRVSSGAVIDKGYAHDSPFTGGGDKRVCKNYHDHTVVNLDSLSDVSHTCKKSNRYAGTGKIFSTTSINYTLIAQMNKELAKMAVKTVEQNRLDNPFTKARQAGETTGVKGGWESVEKIGLKWTEEFKK